MLAALSKRKRSARQTKLEGPRREGRRIPRGSRAPDRLFYCEHIRYTDQLRRFEELFGEERLLVVIYEDFRADNDATVRRILRFLDVDDQVQLEPWEVRRTAFLPVARRCRAVRLSRFCALCSAARIAAAGSPRW